MTFLFAYEWPFVVALALVALLVLGASLGLTSLDSIDADGDGIPDDLDGIASSLALLGFGRAPLVVSLVLLLGLFGGTGLVVSPFLAGVSEWIAGVIAWFAAISVALVGHRALAGVVGRYVPSVETYASRADDRIGRTAVVALRLGEHRAIVRVHLGDGTMLRVPAHSDERMPAAGGAVVVVDHDPASHSDLVAPLPAEASWLPADGTKENVR